MYRFRDQPGDHRRREPEKKTRTRRRTYKHLPGAASKISSTAWATQKLASKHQNGSPAPLAERHRRATRAPRAPTHAIESRPTGSSGCLLSRPASPTHVIGRLHRPQHCSARLLAASKHPMCSVSAQPLAPCFAVAAADLEVSATETKGGPRVWAPGASPLQAGEFNMSATGNRLKLKPTAG